MSAEPILDPETDDEMRPLIQRGIEAMKRQTSMLPPHQRPIGLTSALCVVTEADFVKNASLCLRHVIRNNRTLYVLCKEDVELCAMMTRHRTHKGGHREA